ncbi:DNA topoisomerase IB [Planctomicrobium piriforme]|uniref:DNA topoisomerase n=1 Tax=Planctomicrobium piriforme TaxID=1576369 RepID=A0A1I3RXV2_9PLAN|nr:DNA topoisomerase IB [Planctomicrobium piriforme]SFJ50121.1 DNA topoisomerase-1 [Planctomicrobium piriforme]
MPNESRRASRTILQCTASAVRRVIGRPSEIASQARLVYISSQIAGYTRQQRGSGFVYFCPDGSLVKDAAILGRIAALVIPPAWTDVWICRRPRGHLQATGRDQRGRKQYIYHARWQAAANLEKFANLQNLGETLGRLRSRVSRELRRPGWTLEKLAAVAVRLLDATAIRVGNREYTRDNASYGLTTLEPRHIQISGTEIHLDFIGKSGKRRQTSFRDRVVAPLLGELVEFGGSTLLSLPDGAASRALTAADINLFLERACGRHVTAKDFRTWQATAMAAAAFADICGARPTRRAISMVLRQASQRLGNTASVCRSYYLHPQLISDFESDRLKRLLSGFESRPRARLPLADQRLLYLLERWQRRRSRVGR